MNSTNQIQKAEIHVHLEATITPDLCRNLANKNAVSLPNDIFGNKYAYEWADFYDFLTSYHLILIYKLNEIFFYQIIFHDKL